jgi:hypothetical protein
MGGLSRIDFRNEIVQLRKSVLILPGGSDFSNPLRPLKLT